MKKAVSLILSLIMLLSMAGTVLAAEDNTLTVWCWDPNFNIFAMKEAEKIYQKTNPGFKLDIVEKKWDEVQTGLIAAVEGKALDTLPDIYLMQDMAFRKNMSNYPELFHELDQKAIAFDQFAAYKAAYSMQDGKNYGVPFDNGTSIAAWRVDILEKAGFKPEDLNDITWSRFIEIGKVVLEKTGVPMLAYFAADADFLTMMMQSMGASLFTEDGKPMLNNNPAILEVVKVYTELVKSGVYVEVQNWDEYVKATVTGGCVGTIQGCWYIGTLQSDPSLIGKWAVVNAPKFDGVETATNYTSSGGSTWVVSGSTKKFDLAQDFLAKTFGSNVEFYDAILEKAGAIATYLPAAQSSLYGREQEYFGGQKVYQDIVEFAKHVPSVTIGVYHYEARNALSNALIEIVKGADVQASLDKAQSDVEFNMGL